MAELAGQIAAVRRFTRFFTRQVELLDEGLLASRYSLTEARVLYELAHRDGATARDLVRDLGLDAGYLSRILKAFEVAGLLARAASGEDARLATLALTDDGRAAFAPLDAASNRQVAAMLTPLPDTARARLVAAMGDIERLLGADADETGYAIRPHRVGDMGWITHRQGILYAAEYGFDATFEGLVAEIAAAFVKNVDPAREHCWIAERRGEIVGSVFLVRDTEERAKLRLLYVEPSARGLGIGVRLVDECVTFARAAGYGVLTLWTNDVLAVARRIYETAGFRLVAEDRHHSFGQDLVGQTWELDLR